MGGRYYKREYSLDVRGEIINWWIYEGWDYKPVIVGEAIQILEESFQYVLSKMKLYGKEISSIDNKENSSREKKLDEIIKWFDMFRSDQISQVEKTIVEMEALIKRHKSG